MGNIKLFEPINERNERMKDWKQYYATIMSINVGGRKWGWFDVKEKCLASHTQRVTHTDWLNASMNEWMNESNQIRNFQWDKFTNIDSIQFDMVQHNRISDMPICIYVFDHILCVSLSESVCVSVKNIESGCVKMVAWCKIDCVLCVWRGGVLSDIIQHEQALRLEWLCLSVGGRARSLTQPYPFNPYPFPYPYKLYVSPFLSSHVNHLILIFWVYCVRACVCGVGGLLLRVYSMALYIVCRLITTIYIRQFQANVNLQKHTISSSIFNSLTSTFAFLFHSVFSHSNPLFDFVVYYTNNKRHTYFIHSNGSRHYVCKMSFE